MVLQTKGGRPVTSENACTSDNFRTYSPQTADESATAAHPSCSAGGGPARVGLGQEGRPCTRTDHRHPTSHGVHGVKPPRSPRGTRPTVMPGRAPWLVPSRRAGPALPPHLAPWAVRRTRRNPVGRRQRRHPARRTKGCTTRPGHRRPPCDRPRRACGCRACR